MPFMFTFWSKWILQETTCSGLRVLVCVWGGGVVYCACDCVYVQAVLFQNQTFPRKHSHSLRREGWGRSKLRPCLFYGLPFFVKQAG